MLFGFKQRFGQQNIAVFLGIMVHFLHLITLQRIFIALSCSKLESPHANEQIAEKIQLLCSLFGIKTSQIVAIITDNAAAFIKAFREFGL